jgi:hypothetical protein
LLAAVQAGQPHEPNRYVQRHLAEHVAAPASWSALAQHPDVLDRLDPDSVAAGVLVHAFGRAGEALPTEIAAVASARHLLGPLSPEERKLTRAVAMARFGSDALRAAQGEPRREGEPRLGWAALQPSATHVTLSGHTKGVTSLAALTLADGRCLLASGSWDDTIRLWDPASGSTVGAPLTGHTWSVTSLAALRLADGRCLLASGSRDKTIRLWDPLSGRAARLPRSPVTPMLCNRWPRSPWPTAAASSLRAVVTTPFGCGTRPPAARSAPRSPVTPPLWKRWPCSPWLTAATSSLQAVTT